MRGIFRRKMKTHNKKRKEQKEEYYKARDKFIKLFWNQPEDGGNPTIRDYLSVIILELKEIKKLLKE